MWTAAQLSLGQGLWLPWRALSCPSVTESEYNALLAEPRVCPHLDRISRERLELRGQRQLTLQESWHGACTVRAIAGPTDPGAALASDIDPSTETQHWSRRHPWQCEPGLPDAVVIDCTSDTPSSPPAPPGWTLLQRNGRLLVRNPSGTTCQLEAAQASMLELMNQGMDQQAFLDSLLVVCLAQQRQDSARSVHWSRHLLACIFRVTGECLIGCHAVTFHPH